MWLLRAPLGRHDPGEEQDAEGDESGDDHGLISFYGW
jgi:hypothetical protein